MQKLGLEYRKLKVSEATLGATYYVEAGTVAEAEAKLADELESIGISFSVKSYFKVGYGYYLNIEESLCKFLIWSRLKFKVHLKGLIKYYDDECPPEGCKFEVEKNAMSAAETPVLKVVSVCGLIG